MKPPHRLSSLDTEQRTATCSECGEVDIYRVGKTPERWRCGNKAREHNRRSHFTRCGYEIDPDQFEAILREQGYQCAICGENLIGRRLVLDHCHTTGKFRGGLCHHCNTGLGLFRDDPDLLARAIYYLESQIEVEAVEIPCFEA